jgi:hypothetical protein
MRAEVLVKRPNFGGSCCFRFFFYPIQARANLASAGLSLHGPHRPKGFHPLRISPALPN